MNRIEHLQWCKGRALEYIEGGNITGGITSFISDMTKHPETENHAALSSMTTMLFSGHLKTAAEASKFIEGFN